jgi:hypothetical protein
MSAIGISYQSELLDFLAPSFTGALGCQERPSDRYGLIQRKVMCLKTVHVELFQDFVAPGQNRSDKRRPGHFAVAIRPQIGLIIS